MAAFLVFIQAPTAAFRPMAGAIDAFSAIVFFGIVALMGWAFGCVLAWRYHHQLRRMHSGIVAGFAFGVGFIILPVSFHVLLCFADHNEAHSLTYTLMACGAVFLATCALEHLVCAGLKGIITDVIVQDGTRCPACGYSLLGNVEMTCPECGRVFAYEELGTTEVDFRQQQILAKAALK